MSPRRRTVLATLGSLGVAGGGGVYWQRRRIRRFDQLDTFREIRELSVPSVERPSTVTDGHLEASYERARQRVEGTDTALGDTDAEAAIIDGAWTHLENYPPADPTSHEERIDALVAYQSAVADNARARSSLFEDDSSEPSSELQSAAARLEADLDEFRGRYRGDSLTQVVVQSGDADHFEAAAIDDYESANERLSDPSRSNDTAWAQLAEGRQQLHDANQFIRHQDGPERAEDLTACYERLGELLDVDFEKWFVESEVLTHAELLYRDDVRYSVSEEYLQNGHLALGVRDRAAKAVAAQTLDQLDELPVEDYIYHADSPVDSPIVSSADTLFEAKEDAAEAIDTALDAIGDDPLGQFLLSKVRAPLATGDRNVRKLLDNVNSYESEKWEHERYSAYVHYREAATEASEIPGVVRIVRDEAF